MSGQSYIPSFSRLERAASIIGCEVEDILQLAATGEINISINLGSSVASPEDLQANGYIYLTGVTDTDQVSEQFDQLFEMNGAQVVLSNFVKIPLTDTFKALITPDQIDEIIDMELGEFAPIAPVKLVGQFDLSTVEAETLYRASELPEGNLYSAQFKMLLGDQLCEALCCLQCGQKTTLNEITITRANILKATDIFKGKLIPSECSVNTFEQVKRSMMAFYLDDEDKKPIAVELPAESKIEKTAKQNLTNRQCYAIVALMTMNRKLKPHYVKYLKSRSASDLNKEFKNQLAAHGIAAGPLDRLENSSLVAWLERGELKEIK